MRVGEIGMVREHPNGEPMLAARRERNLTRREEMVVADDTRRFHHRCCRVDDLSSGVHPTLVQLHGHLIRVHSREVDLCFDRYLITNRKLVAR